MISLPIILGARGSTANGWEGDVIHFRGRGQALLTLVDRRTRLTRAQRLHGMDAGGCAAAITAQLAPLPKPARRSITHDNGGEFAAHAKVTEATGIAAYFCDPGRPGQRGSIENINGRLRKPFPRSIALARLTDAEIARRVERLNNTPRKCLDWKTPNEAFSLDIHPSHLE